MLKVWLICWKDLLEAFGQRSLIMRPLIGALVMPFLLVYSQSTHPEVMRAPVYRTFLLPLDLLLLTFAGSTLTLITAATGIAGEKERRTSEALLAAPISDRDLFLGKALAAVLPGVILGYLVQLLFAGLVTAMARRHGVLLELPPRIFVVPVALVPILSILVAGTGLLASARSNTILSATQLGALLSLPVTGSAMYVAFQAMDGPPARGLLFLGGLLLAGALLLAAGTRLVNREAIVSRM